MHAAQIVELAAHVAAHARLLIASPMPLSAGALQHYWLSSRARLDAWSAHLKRYDGPAGPHGEPADFGLLAQEILAADMQTRVWSAVVAARRDETVPNGAASIVDDVFDRQARLRHQMLQMVLEAYWLSAPTARRLDTLRRRTERWTNLLLGVSGAGETVARFAYDPQQAAQFAGDVRQRRDAAGQWFCWPLLAASLRTAFAMLKAKTDYAGLNRQVAQAIWSCFPPQVASMMEIPDWAWESRLLHAADQLSQMVRGLLAPAPLRR